MTKQLLKSFSAQKCSSNLKDNVEYIACQLVILSSHVTYLKMLKKTHDTLLLCYILSTSSYM